MESDNNGGLVENLAWAFAIAISWGICIWALLTVLNEFKVVD